MAMPTHFPTAIIAGQRDAQLENSNVPGGIGGGARTISILVRGD